MTNEHMGNERTTPPFVARTIHRFSVPIILVWLAITVIVSIGVPSLERVEKEHSVSLIPKDAPSITAMKRMGEGFEESNFDSVAMIVLEGRNPSVTMLTGIDSRHPPRKAPMGKAAYVQVKLAGNQGCERLLFAIFASSRTHQ